MPRRSGDAQSRAGAIAARASRPTRRVDVRCRRGQRRRRGVQATQGGSRRVRPDAAGLGQRRSASTSQRRGDRDARRRRRARRVRAASTPPSVTASAAQRGAAQRAALRAAAASRRRGRCLRALPARRQVSDDGAHEPGDRVVRAWSAQAPAVPDRKPAARRVGRAVRPARKYSESPKRRLRPPADQTSSRSGDRATARLTAAAAAARRSAPPPPPAVAPVEDAARRRRRRPRRCRPRGTRPRSSASASWSTRRFWITRLSGRAP